MITNIPKLGLGTWTLRGKSAQRTIEEALDIGFRHIDTADYYKNHDAVGSAIKSSKIPREEIYLVTKIFPPRLDAESVKTDVDRFLVELSTEYIDLLLIHWPGSTPIEETLSAMAEAREAGKINAIGVSNFEIDDLKDALGAGVEILNNQIHFHPDHQTWDLVEFCRENSISVTAYSPFGEGDALDNREVQKAAEKHGRSASQTILNWLMGQDIIAIPRSSKREHNKDNYEALSWSLPSEDIEKINDK